MGDLVECLLVVHKAHIEWLLVLACLMHQYSLVLFPCRNLACSSEISVSVFTWVLSSIIRRRILLACETSSCSVICTLFNITFLGKWDEHGERPFLWSLTSFPDHHTYSVYYVQYCLSFSFEQFYWDIIRTCGFATVCLSYSTSNLWTKCWRLLLPILLFISFPFFIMVQVFTIPFPSVCDLCSFSQIFASCWLDTLQTWLKLSSHWFEYLKQLPVIYFWVFQFHAHAFQLLLFIHSELSLYFSLQFLISVFIFAFCFPFFRDGWESLIRYPFFATWL